MCLLHRRQLDSKSRRIFAAGNLCLTCGLMLTLFFENGLGHRHRIVFDGMRFLLVGLAIVLLFWSARRNSGCVSRP
jgi:hypothetical protein